jgi:adenine/guanine/hypoxanthine permease
MGFISWVVIKLLAGRFREINAGMAALALLSATFYIFYPYH